MKLGKRAWIAIYTGIGVASLGVLYLGATSVATYGILKDRFEIQTRGLQARNMNVFYQMPDRQLSAKALPRSNGLWEARQAVIASMLRWGGIAYDWSLSTDRSAYHQLIKTADAANIAMVPSAAPGQRASLHTGATRGCLLVDLTQENDPIAKDAIDLLRAFQTRMDAGESGDGHYTLEDASVSFAPLRPGETVNSICPASTLSPSAARPAPKLS